MPDKLILPKGRSRVTEISLLSVLWIGIFDAESHVPAVPKFFYCLFESLTLNLRMHVPAVPRFLIANLKV